MKPPGFASSTRRLDARLLAGPGGIPGTVRLPVGRWSTWASLETDAATDAARWWALRWLRVANFIVLFATTRVLADPNVDAVVTLSEIPSRRRAVAGMIGAMAVAALTYRYAPVQTWTPIFFAVIWSFIRDLSRAQTGWHLPPRRVRLRQLPPPPSDRRWSWPGADERRLRPR